LNLDRTINSIRRGGS